MIPTVKTWRCTATTSDGRVLKFHTETVTRWLAIANARDALIARGEWLNTVKLRATPYRHRHTVSISHFTHGSTVYAIKPTKVGTVLALRHGCDATKADALVRKYIDSHIEELLERDDAVHYGHVSKYLGNSTLYERWSSERLPCDYGEKI